jgi:pantoate--beta-alanine ligase
MLRIDAVAPLRATIAAWRRDGARRIGFVPTMGNLHEGHHSLLDEARRRADRVVSSVFVNPTQFGPNEDFHRYPRTLEADAAALEARGCDVLFAPTVAEMYPFGPRDAVHVSVPSLSSVLEGAVRPGHFDGVATVVARLFNMVGPDVAVFGQKDYQQLLVIRRMVADLAVPIEIVAAPTVREPNGLARSSRNQYLDADQRARASVIHEVLQAMRAATRAGEPRDVVERNARERLSNAGMVVDYAVVRGAHDLAETESAPRVALVAARYGATRLIDNLLIDQDNG